MKCYIHSEEDASGTCMSCGRAICDRCVVDVGGKFVCRECLTAGKVPFNTSDITDNDKMMGLLSYVISLIVPVVILLSENGKNRPFQRFHAIQSLILSAVIFVVTLLVGCPATIIFSIIGMGIGGICTLPIYLIAYAISIYYGVQAYQGNYTEIPLITDFIKKQGWV